MTDMTEKSRISNEKIYNARMALAKLANTALPAPVLGLLAPTLDALDPVIAAAMKYGEGTVELEDYLGKMTEVPTCTIPGIPEIRLTYLEMVSLRGIVDFEEVL